MLVHEKARTDTVGSVEKPQYNTIGRTTAATRAHIDVRTLVRMSYTRQQLQDRVPTQMNMDAPANTVSVIPTTVQFTVVDARVLWNTPIDGWTGVADEAVEFVVPLTEHVAILGIVGAFS